MRLQLHPLSFTIDTFSKLTELRSGNGLCYGWYHPQPRHRRLTFRACTVVVVMSSDDDKRVLHQCSDKKIGALGSDSENPIRRFQGSISCLPPVIFLSTQMRRQSAANIAIGLSVAMAILFIVVRVYVARRSRYGHPGSVVDLVRRGQLRSDRRGISRPLKYDDPFNNPLVKVSKSNSTVEMCGKVYRLAPVTLTEEQQTIHQKRRSRAYQWKRPKVFLKEGDSMPADVDPDTIRWIPTNHPFATTASEIDEGLAQNNVYQKHGVPFRIQAEHEALQRKLEMLQNEQNLDKLSIDPINVGEFDRPLKSHPPDLSEGVERGSSSSQLGYSEHERPNFDPAANSVGSISSPEEMQNP